MTNFSVWLEEDGDESRILEHCFPDQLRDYFMN
jgi:hypothetical protein